MNSPTTEHLLLAKSLWNLTDTPVFLRYVANFIYFGKSEVFPGFEVVLRLTGPLGKSKSELEAELAWIHYLDQCGMRVAIPIESRNGHLVEPIETIDGIFFACAFMKINGRAIVAKNDFNDLIFEKWGRYLGHMHRIIKNYSVLDAPRRPMWNQDNVFSQALENAKNENSQLSEIFFEKIEWANGLQKSVNNFGLIHCDLHPGNFLFDNFDNLVAFDFDDGCYNWFAYDFAHIFFALRNREDLGRLPISSIEALKKILQGYRSENILAEEDLHTIGNFYNLRICLIYHWFRFRLNAGEWTQTDLAKWNIVLPWYSKEAVFKIKI